MWISFGGGGQNKFALAVLGAVNTPPMKPGVFLDKTYPYIDRGGSIFSVAGSFIRSP
jgi:hypothetical protein